MGSKVLGFIGFNSLGSSAGYPAWSENGFGFEGLGFRVLAWFEVYENGFGFRGLGFKV